MRRIDIITASVSLKKALEESNMLEIVRAVGYQSQEKKISTEAVVSGFYKYQSSYSKFGKSEKELINIFGLNGLESPKTLAAAMGDSKDAYRTLRDFYSGLSFVTDYLENITAMLKQDNIEFDTELLDTKQTNHESKEILTVIMPESGRVISSPERLVKVLESVRLFYSVLATILNASENDLSVAAIDSGSDKSFDFLGAAPLINGVKDLIMGLWDRVVYYRERKLHEKLDLVAKSLPILEQIHSMEENGKLGREQCEILRRNIIMGAENFIVSGAILPDFSRNNYYNPRELMAPEAKLLVEDNENAASSAKSKRPIEETDGLSREEFVDNDENELSDEEKEVLKKLNARKKK